ncbi:MAG: pilus assembly protein PilM [Bacillota bacterium]|nr:pilus assembly protein PilM [Bacillota bacterium]
MSFTFSVRKNRIVNLIINDHSIRFLELKQAHPPIAQRWGERLLPPGIIHDGKIVDIESLINILEELLDEWKLRKRVVRFLVPDPLVIIRKVTISADIKEDEIKNHLYLEIGTSIHLPFDEPVFDTFLIQKSENQKEVLLFAAPEKYVMEYSDLFSDLGLNPIAAEISPLAIYRLYHELDMPQQNEQLFVVQFGLTSVNMCIFDEKVPYFMRHFPLDFNLDKWELKRMGSVENEYYYIGDESELKFQLNEIIKEMNKMSDFYRYSLQNGKKEISKILLCGDHPMLNSIYAELSNRFDTPIQEIALDASHKSAILPSSYHLALGLALKEVK